MVVISSNEMTTIASGSVARTLVSAELKSVTRVEGLFRSDLGAAGLEGRRDVLFEAGAVRVVQ